MAGACVGRGAAPLIKQHGGRARESLLDPARCFWGCAELGPEVGILTPLRNPSASRICVAALLAVGGRLSDAY